jgi:double-strand break repair protein MRE11
MEILRKFVLGYNPVRIQVVSDQAALFKDRVFNRVNWEDPHFNVDLPIFSIHGNHDDPVREGDEVRCDI